jgi:DNA-binding PadR family transcriptional regulator
VAELYGNPNEGMGLAARVLLHLAALPPLGLNDVASLARTQQGMVAALVVRQGSLVKVLLRLRAGDAIDVERRYVGSVNYRLKVYRLTSLGDSLARDLRRRASPPLAPMPAGAWIAPRTQSDRPEPPPDRLDLRSG